MPHDDTAVQQTITSLSETATTDESCPACRKGRMIVVAIIEPDHPGPQPGLNVYAVQGPTIEDDAAAIRELEFPASSGHNNTSKVFGAGVLRRRYVCGSRPTCRS